MSKVQISPIRVIHSIESTGGPVNTEVVSIVAVDRENNQCWDERNRLFTLSEVEEWPRPQDDVFMTPIAPLETSTVAADGTVIKDTLQPMQRQSNVQTHQSDNDKIQLPKPTQAEIDAQVQERAMKLAAEMRALELAKQPEKSSDEIELDKFVRRFIDKSNTLDNVKRKLVIESTIDIDKLFILTDALGFDKIDAFKSLIANDAVKIEGIE